MIPGTILNNRVAATDPSATRTSPGRALKSAGSPRRCAARHSAMSPAMPTTPNATVMQNRRYTPVRLNGSQSGSSSEKTTP